MVAKINSSVVGFLNNLESRQRAVHNNSVYNPADIFAAGLLLCPSVVTESKKYYGFVETDSQQLRGALVLDYRNLSTNAANVEVVLGYDIDALKYLTLHSLSDSGRYK